MTAVDLLIIVALIAAFSWLCSCVARRRGEDAWSWSLTGALLGPFTFPLLLPSDQDANHPASGAPLGGGEGSSERDGSARGSPS